MDDERIRERERLQIEQIRELDFEELQVEEVDELQDSDDDEDNNNVDLDSFRFNSHAPVSWAISPPSSLSSHTHFFAFSFYLFRHSIRRSFAISSDHAKLSVLFECIH